MALTQRNHHGQTALDPDEAEGLKLHGVASRHELDEHEQHNIESAKLKVAALRITPQLLFSERFLRRLHKLMFGEVWRWAGQFRTTDKNIGVGKWQIGIELKKLCDDALFWHEARTFPPDELALRFKHRLVSIHCFPNGNGRHSRLVADLIVTRLYGGVPFSRGRHSGDPLLHDVGAIRDQYLAAMRAGDRGDFGPLLAFARS